MRRYYHFFKEFVRHPRRTGAVAPSSRWLAREVLRCLDAKPGEVVVEYGPGEGSFTGEALKALCASGKDNRFFAIEINGEFVKRLRLRFPDLAVHEGCASLVKDFCDIEGVDGVDGVISGLPWAAFPEALQDKLLEPMVKALKPGGRFVTFAYVHALRLPAARRFRRKLESLFGEVRCGRTVWRNFPPALCYTAVKSR